MSSPVAIVAIVAVAGIAAGIVFAITRGDDEPTSPTPQPTPDVLATLGSVDQTLEGDALFNELLGRRWVATERFDDSTPTALLSTVEFRGDAGSPVLAGHDGCGTYGGSFTFDGAEIAGGFDDTVDVCDVDTLAISPREDIMLAEGASAFDLIAAGTTVARFADIDTLRPAGADDLPGTWLLDDLHTVQFSNFGTGFLTCGQFRWNVADVGFTAELYLWDPSGCRNFAGESGVLAVDEALVDVIAGEGFDVWVANDGLVVSNGSRAVMLRPMPIVAADPGGITIAAGAAFGFEPGLGVSPDDVLAAVVPHLGEPTRDSGWLGGVELADEGMSTGGFMQCELDDYREVWWDDLVFGFWGTGARTALTFWNVGDPASPIPHPRLVRPPADARSGVSTEFGVGIGDAVAALPDAINIAIAPFDRSADDGLPDGGSVTAVVVRSRPTRPTANTPVEAMRGGHFVVVDGSIVAFGSDTWACP